MGVGPAKKRKGSGVWVVEGAKPTCASHERREGIRLKNWRSNGMFVPSTDDMQNTGVIADLPKERTASMSSLVERTTYGCLRAPGSLRRRVSCFIVSCKREKHEAVGY